MENESRVKFLENKVERITNSLETSVLWLLEGKPINQKMAPFSLVFLANEKKSGGGWTRSGSTSTTNSNESSWTGPSPWGSAGSYCIQTGPSASPDCLSVSVVHY